MKLNLVFPIHNPHATWATEMMASLKKLHAELPSDVTLSFILVNDGSRAETFSMDDVAQIQQTFPAFECISYADNHGKGYALRKGVQSASGDYVIYTDFDFPFGVQSVTATLAKLRDGADIVAALRDSTYTRALKCDKRRGITHFVRAINKYLLRLKDHDAQAGLKGFNRKGRAVFLRTTIDSFLFDTEFIAMAAACRNLRIEDVPVTIAEGIVMSKKKLKVLIRETYHLGRLVFRAMGRFCISLNGIEKEFTQNG